MGGGQTKHVVTSPVHPIGTGTCSTDGRCGITGEGVCGVRVCGVRGEVCVV